MDNTLFFVADWRCPWRHCVYFPICSLYKAFCLLMENSSKLPIMCIKVTESNWIFDPLCETGRVVLQNHQNIILSSAMSRSADIWFSYGTRVSEMTRKYFQHLSSESCFCCMHITQGLEVALQNISWKLPRKANLSHILPCSSSLRGVSMAERMKWLHIVWQSYYVLNISITKVPLDFSRLMQLEGSCRPLIKHCWNHLFRAPGY